ncbi:MAG: hypothetical protein JWQ04_1362 [Pedosphaera sp.]|nr:hypothetical protein [Pedosphaera sp.]
MFGNKLVPSRTRQLVFTKCAGFKTIGFIGLFQPKKKN